MDDQHLTCSLRVRWMLPKETALLGRKLPLWGVESKEQSLRSTGACRAMGVRRPSVCP